MLTQQAPPKFDVLVLGGGPGGATAALALARKGLSVAVVDRLTFPHFHIGESFLPRNLQLIKELGLEERLLALPQVEKHGAEFAMGHGEELGSISFSEGLIDGETYAFNIERAPFDAMLLDAAKDAGAHLFLGVAAKSFPRLADGDVAVVLEDGRTLEGRYLLDASGQSTVLGKHLGLRHVLSDLKKVAYFGHFHHVERPPGRQGGYIRIAMCDEGWFWLIPIDEERTSIGLVLDATFAKTAGVAPNQMLAWAIARCPYVERLCRHATFPPENGTIADFSYRCEPYAGPGYFLLGDAATFIDPIFSTGVCLAMMSAVHLADGLAAMIAGETTAEKVRADYVRYVDGSSSAFFRMVRLFYRHAFRDVLLEEDAPLGVRRAVISLLAGEVFPRPSWAVRWRLAIFLLFVRLQPFWAVAPRKRRWSLFAAESGARTK